MMLQPGRGEIARCSSANTVPLWQAPCAQDPAIQYIHFTFDSLRRTPTVHYYPSFGSSHAQTHLTDSATAPASLAVSAVSVSWPSRRRSTPLLRYRQHPWTRPRRSRHSRSGRGRRQGGRQSRRHSARSATQLTAAPKRVPRKSS